MMIATTFHQGGLGPVSSVTGLSAGASSATRTRQLQSRGVDLTEVIRGTECH
jgi:hypothetical protein